MTTYAPSESRTEAHDSSPEEPPDREPERTGEWMVRVKPIRNAGRPLRKCPKCGLRTTLRFCPSGNCGQTRTIVINDEGSIAKKDES
jgi:hypothetical protein